MKTKHYDWSAHEQELNRLKAQKGHLVCRNYEDCLSGKHKNKEDYGNPRNGDVCNNFKNKYLFETSSIF